MKYCSHCGSPIFDEAVICPKCGCAVEGNKSPQQSVSGGDGANYKIMGICSIVFAGLVGLILSIVGLSSKKGQEYRKLFIAGLIVSIVAIILSIVFYSVIMADTLYYLL